MAHDYKHARHVRVSNERLTLLKEGETVGDIALITHECKTAFFESNLFRVFLWRHLRSERDSCSHYTVSGNVLLWDVLSWVCLANMRGEWTTSLICSVLKVEVVVAIRVLREYGVIFQRCEIDRCTCKTISSSTSCA